jgi:hypothetical protein
MLHAYGWLFTSLLRISGAKEWGVPSRPRSRIGRFCRERAKTSFCVVQTAKNESEKRSGCMYLALFQTLTLRTFIHRQRINSSPYIYLQHTTKMSETLEVRSDFKSCKV